MAKVFFSYSHKDEALRDQLEAHLALLKNQGLIESWHDRRILAGSELDEAIFAQMESANIILMLISSDFLASAYCYSREMTRSMERHQAGEARVIPVILRACDWTSAPFGKLVASPRDGKPISSWPDRDEAFTLVAKDVRRAVEELANAASATPSASRRSGTSATAVASSRTASAPRTSSGHSRKDFTEQDRIDFLEHAFEFIATYFHQSLAALAKQNPAVTFRFDRVDASRMEAKVHKGGQLVAQCCIFRTGIGRPGNDAIAYGSGASSPSGYSELLAVEVNEQSMYLASAGIAWMRERAEPRQLSEEGTAELFWGLFMEPMKYY